MRALPPLFLWPLLQALMRRLADSNSDHVSIRAVKPGRASSTDSLEVCSRGKGQGRAGERSKERAYKRGKGLLKNQYS